MGQTIYDLLLQIFTNAHNMHDEPQRIVSGAISYLSIALSYFAIGGVIIWLGCKSILIRGSVMYGLGTLMFVSGIFTAAQLFGEIPIGVRLVLDFISGALATGVAILFYQRRHFILSMVFQFKYVVGLLRNMEQIEEEGAEK